MPGVDEYYFGWICSNGMIFNAATAFLDENHVEPVLSRNDSNKYAPGKIGKHNVVIGAWRKLDRLSLTSDTTRVATNMIRSFPNIKGFLLLTMGGGAPSERHDIRLGDIVVSESHHNDAVFQLDYGIAWNHISFSPYSVPTIIPTLFVLAVNRLKEHYKSNGNRLDDSINSIIDKDPILRACRRPDPGSDRLFPSCGMSKNAIMRPARTEQKDDPVIHYGRIASGSQIVIDAAFRDELSSKENVLCFERAAAGIVNDFPCLVICGIFHYVDGHDPYEWNGYSSMASWKEYSARAAAAYAKDLLQVIPAENEKNIDRDFSHKTMTMKGMPKILPPAKKVMC